MKTQEMESAKPVRKEKNGLAVFLCVLLVLSILLTALGFNFYRVLFNPEKIKGLLFDEVKESNLVPAIFSFMSEKRAIERVEKGEALSGVSEPDIPLLMSFMQLDDWRKMKELLVKDELIEHLVSVSVDGTYAWLDSEESYPQITWQLNPLKDALTGKPGQEAVMVGLEALPECTEEEIADFLGRLAASPPGVEVLYNLCQFPEPWKEDQTEDYVHALIDVNNNIPAEFSFSSMLQQNAATADRMMPLLKDLLLSIRWLGKWNWIVTLVLLGLILLLGMRSPRKLFKTLGVSLTTTGAVLLLVYVLASGLLAGWLTGLILKGTSEVVRNEVAASLTHLSGEFNSHLLIEALVILVLGIGLLVWNKVISKNKP